MVFHDDGYGYWLLMVSVFVAWLLAIGGNMSLAEIIKAQDMHWLYTIIVVIAATFLNKSGQLSGVSADLVILLILELSAMLNGFHID
jgi:hypothetical protein